MSLSSSPWDTHLTLLKAGLGNMMLMLVHLVLIGSLHLHVSDQTPGQGAVAFGAGLSMGDMTGFLKLLVTDSVRLLKEDSDTWPLISNQAGPWLPIADTDTLKCCSKGKGIVYCDALDSGCQRCDGQVGDIRSCLPLLQLNQGCSPRVGSLQLGSQWILALRWVSL